MPTEIALTQLAFDTAPVGVVLTENRVIRVANQTFADMAGYRTEELIGQSFRMLYDTPREFDDIRDIGLPALSGTGTYMDERLLARRGGSPSWCRFRARTLTPDAPLARMVLSYAVMPQHQTGVAWTGAGAERTGTGAERTGAGAERTGAEWAGVKRAGVKLTPREKDVVVLLSRGLTSKEIALELNRSPRTIEDVRARLLKKLSVRNATELLAKLARGEV